MPEERLQEIREARLKKRELLLAAGMPPYPAEARRSHTLAEVNAEFDQLETDKTPVTVIGRVLSIRRHGGVAFLDIRDASDVLQLQITKDQIAPEFFEHLELLDSGDFIEAAGHAERTKRGVKSLQVAEFHLLSKSIRPLPDTWFGLKDHETRYRQREVDILLNEQVRTTFIFRSKMIQWLRAYMDKEGYIEVETPVLQTIAGGAAAKPFTTHHNALDMPLYLRIASELHLKRLLVAGFEKVYEIERRFRNEGVDRQHNPEFTMLESQWAYADYNDLMDFTETVLEKMVTELTGSTDVTWQGTPLSFKSPFARVRYVELVSQRLGVDILEEKDPAVYLQLFEENRLKPPEIISYRSLVDELYKELIRPTLIQPTLVYDYPIEMAPLAKAKPDDPRIAEKFQLLIHGLEVGNSYTELNDPVLQRTIFEDQEKLRTAGDTEAQTLDEEYLRAMEYGMPPNVGWGLGIDRLAMLLTDSPNIRDTILFPLLKPEA